MIKRSYAKVNIFLKIAGCRDNYHELVSRFVRVKNLYDVISFEKCSCDEFTLVGDFGCETKQNTIYKAYEYLSKMYKNVEVLFGNYKVSVEKIIPEFAGLGGGSSNCATFMIMVNEVCKLGLSKDQLVKIGSTIGADVPFFIYEYDSANVTGIGEIVEKFEEEVLDIEVFTPDIKCDTGAIFTSFRDKFYKEISDDEAKKLLSMKSIDILNELSIDDANDLYLPAVDCEPKLEVYIKNENWYFSGSGSSFFRIAGK
ncbi:MAG: 4-(cytidine 5'-diphospho)-2-C-methyl-D-erythritol kinase [Arcobacteraceae bacterium]|nr:4-(cytidine 5'-diphospho)-2-C-methyl-D-erythritol kinase [Arcobacteraceae bacterium]